MNKVMNYVREYMYIFELILLIGILIVKFN